MYTPTYNRHISPSIAQYIKEVKRELEHNPIPSHVISKMTMFHLNGLYPSFLKWASSHRAFGRGFKNCVGDFQVL
jgi:hypothetical protein